MEATIEAIELAIDQAFRNGERCMAQYFQVRTSAEKAKWLSEQDYWQNKAVQLIELRDRRINQ